MDEPTGSEWGGAYEGGFTVVPNAVLEAMAKKELTTTARFVLVLLAKYADRGGHCWPSQELLARLAGVTDRTVRRSIEELGKAGLVRVRRTEASNHYTLLLPDTDDRSDRAQSVTDDRSGSVTDDRLITPKANKGPGRVESKGGLGESEGEGGAETLTDAGYPEVVKKALPAVARKLDALVQPGRVQAPSRESLAKAMVDFPDRDFVAVAGDLAYWLTYGNGRSRKKVNLANTWRNFLRRADAVEQSHGDRMREKFGEFY